MSLILLMSACILLAVGMPVAFALGISTLAAVLLGSDFPAMVMLKGLYTQGGGDVGLARPAHAHYRHIVRLLQELAAL